MPRFIHSKFRQHSEYHNAEDNSPWNHCTIQYRATLNANVGSEYEDQNNMRKQNELTTLLHQQQNTNYNYFKLQTLGKKELALLVL